MFALYGDPRVGLTLKSYKAQTVNGKSTVTITCETHDHYQLGWALRELAETYQIQKEAIAAAKASERAAKKPKKAALLALPAPQLALPAPLRALPKPGGAA